MWKVVVLLACASLAVTVATKNASASVGTTPSDNTSSTGDTGETSETGDTGETGVSGDTGDAIEHEEITGDSDSSCVTRCGKDQVYTDFVDRGCTLLRCSELGFPINATKTCKPGCICKDSLLFADDGTCVSRDRCPSCGGDPNAESGCGSNCGKTCATYKNKPLRCPIGCIFNGCNCKDGFVFDPNIKKCVLPKQCTPTCGKNEILSNCTNGGCDARNCSQVGKPVPCVKLDPKYCIKGCVCKTGFLRAANGTCIPKNQCDQGCGGDPNAQPGCGVNCGRTCETYKNKPVACPLICHLNGCDCKPGFVFDSTVNKCVLPEDCTPKCGKNEIASNCSNGGCGPFTCSDLGKPVKCVRPSHCEKGCVCQNTYVRADNGTCVPKDKCSGGCGGDPKAKPGCGVNCGKTCSTYKSKSPICPLICKVNGCDCIDGYVFDPNVKKCVLPKDCTPTCGLNEVHNNCANGGCRHRNCSELGKPILCIDPVKCFGGCICKPNHLRAANGTCVPNDQCNQSLCGLNEVDNNCINGFCGHRNCSDIGKPIACIDTLKCIRGCICKRNYLRAANGTCIPKEQCDKPKCPINEVFDVCPAPCPPRRCDVDDRLILCAVPPKPGSPECKPACRCIDNYARNSKGICVPRSQCDIKKCPLHEVFDTCPAPCPPRRCDVDDRLIRCAAPPKPGSPDCKPACRCVDNYARNSKGMCVPRSQCDNAPICGKNEIVSNCTNGGCDARNCSQVGKPVPCVKLDPKDCIKGCICKVGFLRAGNGTCVPKDQCNQGGCGGDPKAKPGCGVNCGKTCSTYKIKSPICPLICKLNGCDCIDGYVFDPNVGKCVLPKDCTPTCGFNEVYNNCANGGCRHRNCSELGKPILCIDPVKCFGGCICKPNHLRAANGTCVPNDQCNQSLCGLNEVDNNCINGFCGHRNCSDIGKPIACIDTLKCIRGCICKRNYLRAANGTCIPKEQCDKPKCPMNEEFDVCPAPCPPRRCDVDDRLIDCAPPPKPGSPECKPACRCINNYARNSEGICVPRSQCNIKKCPRYEVFETCPAPCPPRRCDVDDRLIRCAAPPKPGSPDCKPACRCVDNYARNSKGICVPRSQCDNAPICGKNEIVSNCTNGGCDARNCSQVGKPVPCVKLDPKDCIKGCICKAGFLRAANGTCVPKDQCSQGGCGGDPKAKPGCGVNCGKTCSTYKIKSPICPLICKLNGCDCIDGYVFDPNVGKCVLPKDCTPTCGLNEVYNNCANGGCRHRNCSELGKAILCIDPVKCFGGCICKPNHLRAANGTCVPNDQCNQSLCGVNEVNNNCINGGCGHRNCSQLGKPIGCIDTLKCIKGCICKPNYLRAANGTCIPKEQCDKPKCPINEEFDICPAPCPPRRCDVDDRLIDCAPPPKPGSPECKPACRCINNYARNSEGICVPRSQCNISSEPCSGPNEVLNMCLSGCPPTQTCNDIGKVVECPIQPAICRIGCVCKPGYWRNADNVCIPEKECPTSQCTGQNEYFETCISGCSNQTCNDIGKIFKCPIQPAVCRTGCRCKPGFWRDSKGVCIPESACPTPPCPEGEIYSRCPTVKCEGDYCPKNKDSPLRCPVGIVCDPPRCICAFNRRRDRNTDKCIHSSNCPPIPCDKNEEYNSCPASCPGEQCSDYINNTKCPPYRIGIVVPCEPQCKCKKGYYRNKNDVCIIGAQCGPKNCTVNPTNNTTTSIAEGIASLQAAVTSATGKALVSRMKSAKGENLIMSIFSVFTPLAQLALYAAGVSLQQLLAILNLKNKDSIRTVFPAWTASFENHTGGEFATAAKVYSNKNYALSHEFIKDSVDIFHAEGQDLDFSIPDQAADIINAWVESKTNNRIKNLVSADMLSQLTRIVLVNAIHFKYNWLYQFNVNNTIDNQHFYLSDGSTKLTKMMYQEAIFNYGEDDDCKYLEMPYADKQYSMFIALPKKVDGVAALAEKFSDPTNYNKAYSSLSSQKVRVWLPPWKTETTTDLKDLLAQLGITKIFDSTDSGLKGLLKNPEDVYVSAAIQKAFIEVNEEGSEAAAANGITIGPPRPGPPPPPPNEFRADHPFLFYIRAKGTAIFSGIKYQ